MEALKLIKNVVQFEAPGEEWKKVDADQGQLINYLGFNVKTMAMSEGTYMVVAVYERDLSPQENAARKALGIFAMIFSLGLAWLSPDVRDCFSDKASLRFAVSELIPTKIDDFIHIAKESINDFVQNSLSNFRDKSQQDDFNRIYLKVLKNQSDIFDSIGMR